MRKESDELFWLRYDLTTELCGWPEYAAMSINEIGDIAEKEARAILAKRRAA